MIFQSSLSNLILMAHDSPLHLLHRSAKWKGSSKMAAWIAGIPIPWHPCNTPRGSPYRLRAPLKFFKTTGASPCHVLGWVALAHTYIPYPKKNDGSRISLYLFHSHSSSISQNITQIHGSYRSSHLLKSPTSGSSSSVALHVTLALPPNFCGVPSVGLLSINGQLILFAKTDRVSTSWHKVQV